MGATRRVREIPKADVKIHGDQAMLGWALASFVFAVVAGYLGVIGLSSATLAVALIFLMSLVISFVVPAARGESVT
jgi:uncharacterized membrane protein YtjA (UPF0391 family)